MGFFVFEREVLSVTELKNKHRYEGWIPCVNGHLDFGLMKVGIKGGFTASDFKDVNVVEKNFSSNEKPDSHHRKIILQSKVDWRDTEDEDNTIGQFRLFTCAEVNQSTKMNDRFLYGNVLIYPLAAEPESVQNKTKMKLHELSHEVDEDNSNKVFHDLSALLRQGSKISDLKADCFKATLNILIKPNGIIYLDYVDTTSELDEESQYVIARQVYYYIKYSLHSHRHHIDEQDSITTITSNDSNAGTRLLCQLKRELTTLSRVAKIDKSTHPTNDAYGIIAYSNSLVTACINEGLMKESEGNTELHRLNNVRDSIAALEDNIKRSETIKELISSKAKVWLGFSLIFLWGVSNFLFRNPNAQIDFDMPYAIPIAILFVAFVVYKAFTEYYKTKHDPLKVKEVYYLNKVFILKGIIVPLLIVMILFVIFLNLHFKDRLLCNFDISYCMDNSKESN